MKRRCATKKQDVLLRRGSAMEMGWGCAMLERGRRLLKPSRVQFPALSNRNEVHNKVRLINSTKYTCAPFTLGHENEQKLERSAAQILST